MLHFFICFTLYASISGDGGNEDTFKPHGIWVCVIIFLIHTVNYVWMGPVYGACFAHLLLEDENLGMKAKMSCFPEQCCCLDDQKPAALGCIVETFLVCM